MRVPPLQVLRSFSEAARQGSFSRAAEVLNVTQSAISQQIRHLEREVGTPLFQRAGRQVALTDFGRVYLKLIDGPIAALEEGHLALQSITGRSSIVLRLSRAFGSQWLAPRLPDLARKHPDIFVTCMFYDPSDTPIMSSGDAIVVSGSRLAELTDFTIEPLFRTTLCPVAAPRFGPIDINKLADYPILHTLRRHDDWQTWCAAAQVPFVPLDHGWSFESSGMSYSAAQHGLGIVMAELEFVADDLAQGRLEQISPITVPSAHNYHIAYAPGRAARPAIRKFRDWMAEQVQLAAGPAITRAFG